MGGKKPFSIGVSQDVKMCWNMTKSTHTHPHTPTHTHTFLCTDGCGVREAPEAQFLH